MAAELRAAALGRAARASGVEHASAALLPRLRAVFEWLERSTLRPETVKAEHVAPLRAAGLSDEAIVETIVVCFLFSVINRIASALDFDLLAPGALKRTAWVLDRLGYAGAAIPS